MTDKQPRALLLADQCQGIGEADDWPQLIEAAAELRRLHDENEAKDALLRQARSAANKVLSGGDFDHPYAELKQAAAAIEERLG